MSPGLEKVHILYENTRIERLRVLTEQAVIKWYMKTLVGKGEGDFNKPEGGNKRRKRVRQCIIAVQSPACYVYSQSQRAEESV